jgi:hypothetical protein
MTAMRTMKRSKKVDPMSEQELQELNRQMLGATWEAGLPSAAGVVEALTQLPPTPGNRSTAPGGLTGPPRAPSPSS